MPIYEYICKKCSNEFEKIESISRVDWKSNKSEAVWCKVCQDYTAYRVMSGFKIGTKALETTGRSGYETDDLTIGKLVDEGGIPYEEKNRLRKRAEMITRQNRYTKGLKERAKKYHFDPFED